jgi:mannitol-specific phosphotransferase system IIBC component
MKKDQNMEMLKMLGIDLNPMNQLGSLVSLINASEELPMKREQFDRNMAMEDRKQRFAEDKTNEQMRLAREEELRRSQQMENYNLLHLLQLGMGAASDQENMLRGQINQDTLSRIAGQMGFADLFNPMQQQQQQGRVIKELDTPGINNSLRKLQQTQ